jgi:hypothetical protein
LQVNVTDRFSREVAIVATQRMTVVSIAGKAAAAISTRFERWRSAPDPEAIDQLCIAIREHALSLYILYFAEWVDRWLMGDKVPGSGAVEGRRYQAAIMPPAQAIRWADRCGHQFDEEEWLANRLREAAAVCHSLTEQRAVVVIREVTDASALDDEVRAVLDRVPEWM